MANRLIIQIMLNARVLSDRERACLAHQCTFGETIARFNIFQFYVIEINRQVQMIIDICTKIVVSFSFNH